MARVLAAESLYSLDFNNNLPPRGDWDIYQCLEDSEEALLSEETKVYSKFLILGTIEKLDEVNALIEAYSTNRPIDKINIVDRNILRLSFFSLLYDKNTHPNIIIDEAVKLSQELSNDVSYKFINGILDKYNRDHNDTTKK